MSVEKSISVVVPVYNEEQNIKPFLSRIVPVLEKLGPHEIIFCLDPSPDQTQAVIEKEIEKNPNLRLLVFSRRFGQPAATMAGIWHCEGEWCVVIDVDLQDPPEIIPKLFEKAKEGYDVVTARRRDRHGENLVKKTVSHLGYAVINKIAEVHIPPNTGDFRIMSRRVIDELMRLKEKHGFLRGLVPLVGFPQSEIVYDRDARKLGQGNYSPLTGSLRIGFNGIIAFSTSPLKIVMWTGFLIACISFIASLGMFFAKFALNTTYPMGIPTITILILFMGGVQMVSIGILGEYIGRTYDEVRDRPLYIVKKAVNIEPRTYGAS